MITKKESIELINRSKVSLIAYKSITELQKAELLSELNFIEFDNPDMSPTQMFRELNLEQILENRKKPDFFVIDGTHIKLDKSSLEELQKLVDTLERLIIRFRDSEYKLIVTFMTNNFYDLNYIRLNAAVQTACKDTLMSSSDLVLLEEKEEKTFQVLKLRY